MVWQLLVSADWLFGVLYEGSSKAKNEKDSIKLKKCCSIRKFLLVRTCELSRFGLSATAKAINGENADFTRGEFDSNFSF